MGLLKSLRHQRGGEGADLTDRIKCNPGSVAVITDAGTKVRVSDTAQVTMTKHTCALCHSLPQFSAVTHLCLVMETILVMQ